MRSLVDERPIVATPSREAGLMVVILMGVAGSGKTTVGQLLARRLGWPFYDADDFHPPANVEKMRRGIPLGDADRAPWLDAIHALIARLAAEQRSAIVACSALTAAHRRRLVAGVAAVRFVYLRGAAALLRARLAGRQGHFMPPDLLQSQLTTLEEPDDAVTVGIDAPPDAIAAAIARQLRV